MDDRTANVWIARLDAGCEIDAMKELGNGREVPVSNADKVRLIGNSVCPEVAEAVVRANIASVGTSAVGRYA